MFWLFWSACGQFSVTRSNTVVHIRDSAYVALRNLSAWRRSWCCPVVEMLLVSIALALNFGHIVFLRRAAYAWTQWSFFQLQIGCLPSRTNNKKVLLSSTQLFKLSAMQTSLAHQHEENLTSTIFANEDNPCWAMNRHMRKSREANEKRRNDNDYK